MAICAYTDGDYLEKNPTWHVEDSPWKTDKIWQMILKHRLGLQSVAEVGCGAGEILYLLQQKLPPDCELSGYDISPHSHEMALRRTNERLQFHLADITEETHLNVDLLLIIDLIEHLDDFYGFLRKVKPLAEHTILHIPLDLSGYSLLRSHYLGDMLRSVGHIHFFTKDIALLALKEAGYEVIDWCYPTPPVHRQTNRLRQLILSGLRKVSYRLHPDLSVKLFGGRSLLVLCR
jgi:SAM-dependent methyltransferase